MPTQSVYDLMYEYRLLCAMHALGIKLDPGAAARREALARMLEGEGIAEHGELDGEGHGRRTMTRIALRAHVRISTPHGISDARLRNLSGGGCALACAVPVALGEEVLVSITSPGDRFDYVFPARVVWAERDKVGARFSGMPTRVLAMDDTSRAA